MDELAGWGAWELPASEHLRTVAEILQAPPTPEERRQLRREQAAEEARRADVRDAADSADARAFMRAVNGTPAHNPLEMAAAEPFRDPEAATRRRAAIDVLRQHGLQDVILGGQSGAIFDVNLGLLEPERDTTQRAELDRRYEFQRGEREVADRNRVVEQFRARLDERFRTRGLDRVSHRSQVPDDAARRRYERACADIGQPVDSEAYYAGTRFR